MPSQWECLLWLLRPYIIAIIVIIGIAIGIAIAIIVATDATIAIIAIVATIIAIIAIAGRPNIIRIVITPPAARLGMIR